MESSEAFRGISRFYNEFRPGYPELLLQIFHAELNKAQTPGIPALVLDVGAGTGISTSALLGILAPGFTVVGIEPCEDMIKEGLSAHPELPLQRGAAEHLPFGDCSVTGVFVAQAAQWFDRPRFYSESLRVLYPGGVLAIIQNNRKYWESDFLLEYETFIEEGNPAYKRDYRTIDFELEIGRTGSFSPVKWCSVQWVRTMSCGEFYGLARSSSKVNTIVKMAGENFVEDKLRSLFHKHANDSGNVHIPYVSELFYTHKGSSRGAA